MPIRFGDAFTPYQADLAKTQTAALKNILQQGLPTFPGKTTADISPIESQSLNALSDYLTSSGEMFSGGVSETLARLLSGKRAYQTSPADMLGYFNTAVQQPFMQNLRQDIIPMSDRSFVGPGGTHSGMKSKTTGDILEKAIQTLGKERATLAWQDMLAERQSAERGQDRALSAVPFALQRDMAKSALPLQKVQAGLQLGGLPRKIEQHRLTNEWQKWAQSQPGLNPGISQAISSILGIPAQFTYNDPGSSGDFLGSLASGAGNALTSFAMSGGDPVAAIVAALAGSFGKQDDVNTPPGTQLLADRHGQPTVFSQEPLSFR